MDKKKVTTLYPLSSGQEWIVPESWKLLPSQETKDKVVCLKKELEKKSQIRARAKSENQ